MTFGRTPRSPGLSLALVLSTTAVVALACGGAEETDLFSQPDGLSAGTTGGGPSGETAGETTGAGTAGTTGTSAGTTGSTTSGTTGTTAGTTGGGTTSGTTSGTTGTTSGTTGNTTSGTTGGTTGATTGNTTGNTTGSTTGGPRGREVFCGREAVGNLEKDRICEHPPEECCGTYQGPKVNLACVTDNTCTGVPIDCHVSSDCPNGQACCGAMVGAQWGEIRCRAQCNNSGGVTRVTMCDPELLLIQCPLGQTCKPSAGIDGFGYCDN